MPPMVAEAAAAASLAARGAFRYNRMNYMFDNNMRWSRYTAGYSMAMAQTSMYREDIRDLTALTVTKQDTYHTVGVIFFVLNFQLIMAGRLGVHGPSPPGWLLGLYWTNICSALMFLVTFTWLAMHASARATAGAAHMLTRNVRLPIPTPKMLDKARTTGNTYEKQRVTDMFRIPFVAPAPTEGIEEKDPETGRLTKTGLGDRRMPKWHQDELKELHAGEGASPSYPANPEHFELYRGLQEEWWGHDIYARIGVLFFMSHWLTSASLYSMCHVFGELRCLWPAWSVTACFVTAHYGVLSLDIVNMPRDGALNLRVEKIVPFVPVIAVLGMSLDYSVITPSPGWQAFIYFLSWICYAIQFAWAIRLYELAAPQSQKEQPEQPGQSWWPSEWQLPPAFQDALYVVAPPKALEPGQTDLLQEMKAAKGAHPAGPCVSGRKARAAQPALFPWKLFRGAIITSISMWLLIMVGRAFEQVNGERQLLKQEGRVMRWPSHMQPWMPPWTRHHSRNEWCHAGGCDRRLQESKGDLADIAQQLISTLRPLAEVLDTPHASQAPTKPTAAPMLNAEVAWPAGLEPAHLASHGGVLAALARAGHGALVHLSQGTTGGAMAASKEPMPFALEGLEELGEIVGAALHEAGLVVTTHSGAVAECAGAPVSGKWSCQQVGPKLPVDSAMQSAVAARVAGTGRLRAVVPTGGLDGEEEGLLLLDAADGAGSWLPAGEIRMPAHAAGRAPHLSMSPSAEELLISTGDGAVLKWPLAGSEIVKEVAAPSAAPWASKWHGGACGLGGDRVARLMMQPDGAAPKLFVSAATS